MKIFKQMGIILGVCLVSDGISCILPFTMPATIIGMLLLLVLLMSGLIKKEQIETTADFFLSNLPFFFVPAVVQEPISSHNQPPAYNTPATIWERLPA